MNSSQSGVSKGPVIAFRDGLGERLRVAGDGGRMLEVLRFDAIFEDSPKFESALRERVARFAAFHDPAFASIVRIDRPSPASRLALVSAAVEGRRLSTVIEAAAAGRLTLRIEPALTLLRQLVAAVTRLHVHARDVGHGALSPERVTVGPQGQIVVVEHVLGGALEQLQWPRRRLWCSLRIAMPSAAALPRFDCRADLVQVGAVALALLAGRPLGNDDYPDGVGAVMREVSDRVGRAQPTWVPGVATWLARALKEEGRPFGSMREALAALDEVLESSREPRTSVVCRPHPTGAPLVSRVDPAAAAAAGDSATPMPRASSVPTVPAAAPRLVVPAGHQPWAAGYPPLTHGVRWLSIVRVSVILAAIGVTTLAGAVRYFTNSATSAEAGIRPMPTPPPPPPLQLHDTSLGVMPSSPIAVTVPEPALDAPVPTSAPVAAPAAGPRPGWIAISAPVEMDVSEHGRPIASTRLGRIALDHGRHELLIENRTLGVRETRVVEVRPGEETPLTVNLPFGTVELNATPWAEVWLDGEKVGDTPIGNLAVPIGPHEFVFRHPDLGERRYAVSIRVDQPVRLSIDMTKR